MWKRLSFFKKIFVIFTTIVLYVNVGILYISWVDYAVYYPTSTASKILCPFAPILITDSSPFSNSAPSINVELEKKYGSFKKYQDSHPPSMNFLLIIIWLPMAILFYLASALSWFVWLVALSGKSIWWLSVWFFKFLFMGGMLRTFGLLPQ